MNWWGKGGTSLYNERNISSLYFVEEWDIVCIKNEFLNRSTSWGCPSMFQIKRCTVFIVIWFLVIPSLPVFIPCSKTTLHYDIVSHWLSLFPEWSLVTESLWGVMMNVLSDVEMGPSIHTCFDGIKSSSWDRADEVSADCSSEAKEVLAGCLVILSAQMIHCDRDHPLWDMDKDHLLD